MLLCWITNFAIIEGVFDKTKYFYHLFRKENFVGICSRNHPFAKKEVTLQELFSENIILREEGFGTRKLFEQALTYRGFNIGCFKSHSSISDFSVITDIVSCSNAITSAYEPIAHSRNGLACFRVSDMQISGDFNFVYCNEKIAQEKIQLFFGK